jgi:hypothetical protein
LSRDVAVGFLHFMLEGLEILGLGEVVDSPTRADDHDVLLFGQFGGHADVAEELIAEEPVGPCYDDAADNTIGMSK